MKNLIKLLLIIFLTVQISDSFSQSIEGVVKKTDKETKFNINIGKLKGKRIIYFNGNKVCSKASAVYYAYIDSTDNHWTMYKYRTNGKLHLIGNYSDSNLKIADGLFTYFYGDSMVYEYQKFENNKLVERESIKGEFPDTIIYVYTDEMPEFYGGIFALRKWIAGEINYPVIAQECGIQGTVYLRFEVMWDGTIGKVEIQKGADPLYDEEAIRAVKILPSFKPGFKNGLPVNVWYSVPVVFKLAN